MSSDDAAPKGEIASDPRRESPDREGIRRRQQVLLSGHTGDLGAARTALRDADPELRAAALGALQKRGSLGPSELTDALADPDSGVRRRAAELAARDESESVTLALLDLLGDADALVAEMAAWALGERQATDAVVVALCAMAQDHEDPLCRESAVAALGALGDERGLPAILRGTTDRPAIRRRAVIALAPFEGPEVEAALVRARSDRDWQVRQAAEDLEGRNPG